MLLGRTATAISLQYGDSEHVRNTAHAEVRISLHASCTVQYCQTHRVHTRVVGHAHSASSQRPGFVDSTDCMGHDGCCLTHLSPVKLLLLLVVVCVVLVGACCAARC